MTERFNRSVRNFDFTTVNPIAPAGDRQLCQNPHRGNSAPPNSG